MTPRTLIGVAAATLVVGLAAVAYRVTRPAAPPPTPWVESSVEPARPPPLTEEEEARAALARLARPTVDLAVWSRNAADSEADCMLVLAPLAPGQTVTVRPGAGCELVRVNGAPVAAGARELSAPPLTAGLNWLRVRTTLPRKVLGAIDVPADPPFRAGAVSRATAEELAAYERGRHAIYPPGKFGGSEEPAARVEIDRMPDYTGPLSRKFFHIWLDLAAKLTASGHGTPVGQMSGEVGAGVWEDPEVLAASRVYMDTVQQKLTEFPDRWFLWLGLAWQLRWGNAWDGARTAFVQALAVDPNCGWTWFELARWERKMESDGAGRDPRTRTALAHASLTHFRLARKHLAGHQAPGMPEVLAHIDGAIEVMQKLVRRPAR